MRGLLLSFLLLTAGATGLRAQCSYGVAGQSDAEGSSLTKGREIAVDAYGNTYVAMVTDADELKLGDTTFELEDADQTVLVVKLNANNVPVWLTRIDAEGSHAEDIVQAMEVDLRGRCYLGVYYEDELTTYQFGDQVSYFAQDTDYGDLALIELDSADGSVNWVSNLRLSGSRGTSGARPQLTSLEFDELSNTVYMAVHLSDSAELDFGNLQMRADNPGDAFVLSYSFGEPFGGFSVTGKGRQFINALYTRPLSDSLYFLATQGSGDTALYGDTTAGVKLAATANLSGSNDNVIRVIGTINADNNSVSQARVLGSWKTENPERLLLNSDGSLLNYDLVVLSNYEETAYIQGDSLTGVDEVDHTMHLVVKRGTLRLDAARTLINTHGLTKFGAEGVTYLAGAFDKPLDVRGIIIDTAGASSGSFSLAFDKRGRPFNFSRFPVPFDFIEDAEGDVNGRGHFTGGFTGNLIFPNGDTLSSGIGSAISVDDQSEMFYFSVECFSLSGYVADDKGDPVTRGQVTIARVDRPVKTRETVQIRPDGSFLFSPVKPGGYYLFAQPDRSQFPGVWATYYAEPKSSWFWFMADTIPITGIVDSLEVELLPITPPLQGQVKVSGRLEEGNIGFGKKAAKDPLSGVDIRLAEKPDNVVVANTTTDTAGNFTIDGVEPGTYSLYPEIAGVPVDTDNENNFTVEVDSSNEITFVLVADSTEIYVDSTNLVGVGETGRGIEPAGLYPNPAKDRLTIGVENTNEATVADIRLTDALGKVIHTRRVNVASGSNEFALDVADLPKGIYNVIITDADQPDGLYAYGRLVIVK